MSKMDISISRDATYNTGNYSSIKPSVTITIKDIDANDVLDKYKKASLVLDLLLMKETIALGNEMGSAQELGYKKYVAQLESADDNIMNETKINELLKTL